jgi:hypothetical protein
VTPADDYRHGKKMQNNDAFFKESKPVVGQLRKVKQTRNSVLISANPG